MHSGTASGTFKHNRSVYYLACELKADERWSEQQEATFSPGKGSHLRVFLNGKQSVFPMHGGAELAKDWKPPSKANMLDYPVTLTPDGDTVLVTFADVPEAITFGNDEDEALLYAVEALESALSMYVDARQPLPTPGASAKGQRTVRPSPLECAKLGVYQAMTEQGIKKA